MNEKVEPGQSTLDEIDITIQKVFNSKSILSSNKYQNLIYKLTVLRCMYVTDTTMTTYQLAMTSVIKINEIMDNPAIDDIECVMPVAARFVFTKQDVDIFNMADEITRYFRDITMAITEQFLIDHPEFKRWLEAFDKSSYTNRYTAAKAYKVLDEVKAKYQYLIGIIRPDIDITAIAMDYPNHPVIQEAFEPKN